MNRRNKWWDENVEEDIHGIIIKLKCTLSGKNIDRDWTKDLSLDYEDIDTDMEQIPSILAFWAAVLAEARKQKSLIEVKMDIRRSKILKGIKDRMQEGVKLTNNDKEDIINVDKDYSQLKAKMIEVDATISKLFGIVDSLKIKADNLRSFAAMKRAELTNT